MNGLISIKYTDNVLSRIEEFKINRSDIERRAVEKVKELKKIWRLKGESFPTDDSIEFTKEFPDMKTWKKYIIIGNVKKADNDKGINVFISDLGSLSERINTKAGEGAIYSLESNEDGMSIKEWVEYLKEMKKNEQKE